MKGSVWLECAPEVVWD